jgi:hypothetical protein
VSAGLAGILSHIRYLIQTQKGGARNGAAFLILDFRFWISEFG